jgi:hypothetical protein
LHIRNLHQKLPKPRNLKKIGCLYQKLRFIAEGTLNQLRFQISNSEEFDFNFNPKKSFFRIFSPFEIFHHAINFGFKNKNESNVYS